MKKKFYIVFAISILIFSLIFIVLNKTVILDKGETIDTDIEDVDIDENEDNTVNEDIDNNKDIGKDELLFLMLGVDSDEVDKYSGIRTDTMILGKTNFKTGETDLLSIPRDTRVKVKGSFDKINHAHSYEGVDLTLETVRDFLNIDLEYYVKLNYGAVKEVVDEIGGIEIDVPRRMKYDDPHYGKEFHIDLQKGLQTLNGDKSLEFLRWRQNNDGTGYPDGDVGRIKAQQMFIKELIKQTIDVKNIFKIPKLIRTYYYHVNTNIPINTMVKAGKIASSIDMDTINTYTLPGEGKYIGDVSYFIYEEEATRELVEELFGDYLK